MDIAALGGCFSGSGRAPGQRPGQASDSGPGIAAELAARLYQPFSVGNTHHGSGLGLAICREIALALEGSIALENRLDHGRVTGLDATMHLPLGQNGASGGF
ncbi:MAG: integral rane sensor signal transduction histidine kinase [Polaromonas sp.]|nr:integral rane sensor signal transduction histidine kinase [Polaromonas sp.]